MRWSVCIKPDMLNKDSDGTKVAGNENIFFTIDDKIGNYFSFNLKNNVGSNSSLLISPMSMTAFW